MDLVPRDLREKLERGVELGEAGLAEARRHNAATEELLSQIRDYLGRALALNVETNPP